MAFLLEGRFTGTLSYIIKKFGIDIEKASSPIEVGIGRFKDFPRLLHELGLKKGAEIGVYRGEYSKWMCRYNPGVKLYCVDSWEWYEGYKDFKSNDIESSYEIAKKNTQGFDCELLKGWSHEISMGFDNGSLDFVFIDGNHSFESVVKDLDLWSTKVRRGGIVSGHDYDDYSHSHRWKEMHVKYAVDGWVKAYKIWPLFVLTKNKNRTWFYVQD